MKTAKRLACLLLSAVLLLLCTGCGESEPPPDFEGVSKVFRENRSDFILIAQYLTALGGDCVIDEADGTVRRRDSRSYAFSEEEIGDPEIEACVERLLIGQRIKKIYRKTNTILFYLWGNALPPSECGVAFRIVLPEEEAEAPGGNEAAAEDAQAEDEAAVEDAQADDASAGAPDGGDPEAAVSLNVEYLVRREPLPEPDWYYYLSDYNEWKYGQ